MGLWWSGVCEKLKLLYEGKGKRLYSTSDPGLLIADFKDDLTAFNAQKKGYELGKGEINCRISAEIFSLLEENGIKTHFKRVVGGASMLCLKVEIIPIEVVVRNISAGSLSSRLGIPEGFDISHSFGAPLVEFYYKNDDLNDPIITDSHCMMMNLATVGEIGLLKSEALRVNSVLVHYFGAAGLDLVDFKLEFGRLDNGLILADEISPDSCRLWDKVSMNKMDKDRFRQDLGGIGMAYAEVLERILGVRK